MSIDDPKYRMALEFVLWTFVNNTEPGAIRHSSYEHLASNIELWARSVLGDRYNAISRDSTPFDKAHAEVIEASRY